MELRTFRVNSMFDFKKKILNPLITETKGKTDAALRTQSISDKIENLLSAKAEAKDSFDRIEDDLSKKGLSWVLAAMAGLIVMLASSVPLIITGAAMYATGYLMGLRGVFRKKATIEARDAVDSEISGKVQQLAASNPQEAIKSARFLKALKQRFNLASANETEVNQLRLALAPAPNNRGCATFGV